MFAKFSELDHLRLVFCDQRKRNFLKSPLKMRWWSLLCRVEWLDCWLAAIEYSNHAMPTTNGIEIYVSEKRRIGEWQRRTLLIFSAQLKLNSEVVVDCVNTNRLISDLSCLWLFFSFFYVGCIGALAKLFGTWNGLQFLSTSHGSLTFIQRVLEIQMKNENAAHFFFSAPRE